MPTGSDTDLAVQPQKMARGLKFRIKEEEGLYHVAKITGYCTADHSVFLHMQKAGFSHDEAHMIKVLKLPTPKVNCNL